MQELPPKPRSRSWRQTAVLLGCLLVFGALVLKNAWVCDDAYILFRTVDNAVHGHGLTWNPPERVQVFTTPLWMLLLTACHAVTGEIYYTSLAVSVLCSLGAVALALFAVARSFGAALVAVAVLLASRAFVDYSTSGLAHPLTHLLLAWFLVVWLRGRGGIGRLRHLALVTALLAVNRMDTVLLVAPALLVVTVAARGIPWRRRLAALATGMLPFVLWEAFSLVYYGDLVPNSAHAKLGAAVPAGALLEQGVFYLAHSLLIDPVTLVALAAASAAVLVCKRSAWPLVAGVGLYLAYLVKIGGGFMSGRHLAAPLLCTTACLAAVWPGSGRRVSWPLAVAPLALAFVPDLLGLVRVPSPFRDGKWSTSHLVTGRNFGQDPADSKLIRRFIHDERATYYPDAGLLNALTQDQPPEHRWARRGRRVRAEGPAVVPFHAVGYFGYFAGPAVHVVDRWALGDALLARLPADLVNFGAGHYPRSLPNGYLETLRSGENRLWDPSLREYHADLSLVIRGALFDGERWRAILRLLGGRSRHLLEDYARRPPLELQAAQLTAAAEPRLEWWTAEGVVAMPPSGVVVHLEALSRARRLELGLNHTCHEIAWLRAGEVVATESLRGPPGHVESLRTWVVEVPEKAVADGYDAVRLTPRRLRGSHVLGHVRPLEP